VGEGLALRSAELVVLMLRDGHADHRLEKPDGEHESGDGAAPQRGGEGIGRAADPAHARVVEPGIGEPQGIVFDLLPDPGPQGGVEVSARQQQSGLSPVGEGVLQRRVPGIEGVGKHAGRQLVALAALGLDGGELLDAAVELAPVAAQHRHRERVGQIVGLIRHVVADRGQGLHGREDGWRAPAGAADRQRGQDRRERAPGLAGLALAVEAGGAGVPEAGGPPPPAPPPERCPSGGLRSAAPRCAPRFAGLADVTG
jgi:hypothetical protein